MESTKEMKNNSNGFIPDNWREVTLGDHASVLRGGSPRPIEAYLTKDPDGINWIKIGDVGVGDKYINQTEERIIPEGVSRSRKVFKGDFLLSNSMSFGRPYILNVDGCIHDGWLVIQEYYDSFTTDYLYYALSSQYVLKQYCSMAAGSSVLNLNKDIVKKVRILVPPKEEQKKIANALSSIDNLIADLNLAIEKKRQIKEGLMQNLLTGSIRLRGFSGEWQNKTVGEIGFTYSGLTGKGKNDFGHGEALYITFLNVLNNPILKTDIFEKVDVKDGERQNKALKGDLFFNTSSETPEEVGICAMLNEGIENLYLNSFCFGFRLTDPEVDGLYLSYFWRSKLGREIMTTLAQGATRYNLSKEYFNKTKILLPPLNLQRHIANTLMIAEREIALLEAKREKYNLIKQGMMQELLTGKTRLI